MWPSLLDVQTPTGPVPVGTYGLLVSVGFAVAFGVFATLGRRFGAGPGPLVAVFGAAGAGGLLGARLLYAVAVGGVSSLFGCTGGFAFYGGVIGGLAAATLVAHQAGLPLVRTADAAAPAVVLGHGIGRLGCFFAGCCHGAPIPHPEPGTPLLPDAFVGGQITLHPHFPFLSTTFAGGASRLVDVPLYPTQLWLSAGSALLGAALLAWWPRRRFDGQVAALALLCEPVVRGIVEAFRADHRGTVLQWTAAADLLPPGLAAADEALPGAAQALTYGVTTSQALGLALMGLGAWVWWRQRGAGRAADVPLADAWEDALAEVSDPRLPPPPPGPTPPG